MGERLYKDQPYMVEGMFVVGVKPKSLGEGVVPIVYSRDYTRAWQYWDDNHMDGLSIFMWSHGSLKYVGRKMKHKVSGATIWIPVPPEHLEITA